MLKTSLAQWEAALAIVEHGSLARAAEQFHRSQPALSYQLGQLQERLGLTLFTLEGRRLVLTEAGQELLEHARVLLENWGELEQHAEALRNGDPTVISLVIDSIFPRDVLFAALKQFNADSPQVQVHIKETVRDEGLQQIRLGIGDLYIVSLHPNAPIDKHLLVQMPFVLVARSDHPVFQRAQHVTAADFHRYPLIQVIDRDQQQSNKYKRPFADSWYFTSIEAARDAVLQQLGYAWLPHYHVRPFLADGRLRIIADDSQSARVTSLFLVRNDNRYHAAAVGQLQSIIEQQCAGIATAS